MKVSDLPLLQSVSTPTIHPSGDRAVVSVTHPNLDADANVGQLWEVLLTDAPAARRITRGFRDTAPQFSPNGRLLAFIRATPDAPGQLHVVDSLGGEPVPLTDTPLGVTAFRWSPDGDTHRVHRPSARARPVRHTRRHRRPRGTGQTHHHNPLQSERCRLHE